MNLKNLSREKLEDIALKIYIGSVIVLWGVLICQVIDYHVSNGIY